MFVPVFPVCCLVFGHRVNQQHVEVIYKITVAYYQDQYDLDGNSLVCCSKILLYSDMSVCLVKGKVS